VWPDGVIRRSSAGRFSILSLPVAASLTLPATWRSASSRPARRTPGSPAPRRPVDEAVPLPRQGHRRNDWPRRRDRRAAVRHPNHRNAGVARLAGPAHRHVAGEPQSDVVPAQSLVALPHPPVRGRGRCRRPARQRERCTGAQMRGMHKSFATSLAVAQTDLCTQRYTFPGPGRPRTAPITPRRSLPAVPPKLGRRRRGIDRLRHRCAAHGVNRMLTMRPTSPADHIPGATTDSLPRRPADEITADRLPYPRVSAPNDGCLSVRAAR
jgi:hypothetical protein